jgi:hypothetical protein
LLKEGPLDSLLTSTKVLLADGIGGKREMTLAAGGFDRYAKTKRCAAFLAEIETVVPWAEFCSLVEPFYPKAGSGRRLVRLERVLRIYSLQQWFDISRRGSKVTRPCCMEQAASNA